MLAALGYVTRMSHILRFERGADNMMTLRIPLYGSVIQGIGILTLGWMSCGVKHRYSKRSNLSTKEGGDNVT